MTTAAESRSMSDSLAGPLVGMAVGTTVGVAVAVGAGVGDGGGVGLGVTVEMGVSVACEAVSESSTGCSHAVNRTAISANARGEILFIIPLSIIDLTHCDNCSGQHGGGHAAKLSLVGERSVRTGY